MHSVEMVKRQAAVDSALQERIQKLAKAQGRTVTFDTTAARGDANLKRLLWMEQAAAALDAGEPEEVAEEAPDKSRTDGATEKKKA